MMLNLRQLTKHLLKAIIGDLPRPVIVIGGTGCVGKSTFAIELQADLLQTSGRSVSVLDLDCYLTERHRRETDERVVTGYDPAGYRLESAVKDIESLLEGHAVRVFPYDKATSRMGQKMCINPAEVLVIEGVMALTDDIRRFRSVGMFMDAATQILYANRLARETALGFERERIERKFQLLSRDYDRFIRPQRDHAEMLIEIGDNYSFTRLLICDTPPSKSIQRSRPPVCGCSEV